MTPKEKAKDLFEKFDTDIRTSDFHIPEFISGVPCADGSEAYTKILNEETKLLAKQCSLIAVDEILNSIERNIPFEGGGRALIMNPKIEYFKQVKTEINKL